ncbi:unnamed protein product [Brassica rapa subsp. narinosa]
MRVGENERLYIINSKVCFDIQRLVIVPPEVAYGKKGVQLCKRFLQMQQSRRPNYVVKT